LTDDSGNVLALRTTNPEFKEELGSVNKSSDQILGSWEHTINKGIITFEKDGLVLATYDNSKSRRWEHIAGDKYSYTRTSGKRNTVIITGDTMFFVEPKTMFKKIK
jgi:hypothetical protein